MRSQSKHFSQTTNFRWLSCGVPPVLIPNTEVKPTYTDSTVLETAWEDRQLPDPKGEDVYASSPLSIMQRGVYDKNLYNSIIGRFRSGFAC